MVKAWCRERRKEYLPLVCPGVAHIVGTNISTGKHFSFTAKDGFVETPSSNFFTVKVEVIHIQN